MKSINWHGTILTDEYYILPNRDSERLELPLIKTPIEITDRRKIVDWTFATLEDAKVHEAGCPKCGDHTIMSSIGVDGNYCVSHWMCHICYHRWDTDRGITIKPAPVQMTLFEAVQ